MDFGQETTELDVRYLRDDEQTEWESLVESSPQGTIFHKYKWLESFKDYSFKILVCTHKHVIIAGMPLPYTIRFHLKFGVNPPFTPYQGIIFKATESKYVRKLSFEKAVSRLLAEKAKNSLPYFRYCFHYNFVDAQPLIWAGFSVTPNYTYILNLESSSETILENMEKTARNRIKRALKYNLEFCDATITDIVDLTFLTYARKGQQPPYSRQRYQEYWEGFSKIGKIKAIIAKDHNELIAGGAIVYDTKSAYYLVGGVNQSRNFSGIGQLALWNLIEYSKSIGLENFDFEGSMNENIEQFFRHFGGRLTQRYTIYKNNTVHHFTNLILSLTSRK
jgi:hypothetical protein